MRRPASLPLVAGAVLLLFLPCSALAQQVGTHQPNSATASMTFSGFDHASNATGPIEAPIGANTPMTIAITSNSPLMPFILFGAGNVVQTGSSGQALTPGQPNENIVDLDLTTIFTLFDGTQPALGGLNPFAVLNSAGEWIVQIPVGPNPSGAPLLVGGFQTMIVDPSQPSGLAVTAASKVVVAPEINALAFGGGTTPDTIEVFNTSEFQGTITNTQLSTSVDTNEIRLAGFQNWSDTATSPFWRQDLTTTTVTAVTVNENPQFRYIRTRLGDLYLLEDNDPDPLATGEPHQWGFALSPVPDPNQPGQVLGPQFITDTLVPGEDPPPASGEPLGSVRPFKFEVQVQGDRLAYVKDPVSGNDAILLAALDGSPLPGSGSGLQVADVTPTSPILVGIAQESLTLTSDNLWFVGSTVDPEPAQGGLFVAPSDGSAAAAPFLLPALGTGSGATLVRSELRYSEDRTLFVSAAGPSTTEQDLYLVQDTGAGAATVTNLTSFATATDIMDFGDASDGTDDRVAVSPGAAVRRVAFVTLEAGSQELYIVDAATAGAPTLLTSSTVFDPTLDTVLEPRWFGDDILLVWIGETPTQMDLFGYEVSTNTWRNFTSPGTEGTGMMTGGGAGDPNGSTVTAGPTTGGGSGSWYYVLKGEQPAAGSTTSATNVTAVNVSGSLTTSTVFPVTGGTLNSTFGVTVETAAFQFSTSGDVVAMQAQSGSPTGESNVFTQSCNLPSSPKQVTCNEGSGSNTISNLALSPNGSLVVFSDNVHNVNSTTNPNETEQLFMANTSVTNSATLLFNQPVSGPGEIGRVTDGTIRWSESTQGLGFNAVILGYGCEDPTTSAGGMPNPTDATLIYVDVSVRLSLTIDPTPQAIWNYEP